MNWTEKYKPKTFEDIVGQERIVNYYKKYKQSTGKIRNSIFRGRSGTGKTSMAHVIANEFSADLTVINGSADRSLTYFRDKLIPTMRVASFIGLQRIIYIDETENVMSEAWMVLKSPIEQFQNNAPVIFSCNEDKNIPEAIRSRCDVFDFAPISKSDTIKSLRQIAEKEQLDVKDEVLGIIYDKAKGDLRKAITLLENYSKKAMDFGKNEFEDMFVLTG